MKQSYFTSKLISSIFITILLVYFMIKTTSPKIIFIPFFICSITMVGKNLALIFEKQKLVVVFSKLFMVGFLLFWFGVLVVGGYISIRDKNYSMLIFSIPFWLVGVYLVKNKLLNMKVKNNAKSRFSFGIMISVALVMLALLAGIFMLGFGIIESNTGIIFAGAFFTFGAFTFVLGALTVKGYFDKLKVDVLGLYVGVLFVVIGIGIITMIYRQEFGFWIIIPVLLVVVGVFQIRRCIKSVRK